MKPAFSLTAFAAAATLACSALAQQPATKNLKFQSTWPASLTLQDNFRYFAERVDKLTSGAVKIEGGTRVLPAVEAILAADIPVMGHVGLTPQSYRKLGGFKVQGKGDASAQEIVADAKALSEAGCFAIVLECVPDAVARMVTDSVDVPTIGIGAGSDCDGQVDEERLTVVDSSRVAG